jgi:uncharacterized membrane protein
MIIPILVLIIVLLVGLGAGGIAWFIFRSRRSVKHTTAEAILVFRRRYIILPVVIFLLSIALTAYFYRLLPAEVAYNFDLGGLPDRWTGRVTVIFWMLLPQFILTLMAIAITWGMIRLGIPYQQTSGNRIKPERILSIMGNMVGLPQIILCFALVNIFSYNSYQVHIMPLWIFALIIMGLGAILLSICFFLAIRRA